MTALRRIAQDGWFLNSDFRPQHAALCTPLPQHGQDCYDRAMTEPATGPKILVVDDDADIRDVIRIALEGAGYRVEEAGDGAHGVERADATSPDLIVLDIGMPEMSGFDACKTIRKTSDVPILFLTARDEEIDRVLGFELGADDFVAKPFSPRELVLRIRAILSRKGKSDDSNSLRHGDLNMDAGRHHCALNGQDMTLTGTEFSLLHALLKSPDQVLSRVQLVEKIYGPNTYLSDRTMDSHIRNIRAKAAELGYKSVITTVHGVGVKLGTCRP